VSTRDAAQAFVAVSPKLVAIDALLGAVRAGAEIQASGAHDRRSRRSCVCRASERLG
jgi:hypothetical protein